MAQNFCPYLRRVVADYQNSVTISFCELFAMCDYYTSHQVLTTS